MTLGEVFKRSFSKASLQTLVPVGAVLLTALATFLADPEAVALVVDLAGPYGPPVAIILTVVGLIVKDMVKHRDKIGPSRPYRRVTGG